MLLLSAIVLAFASLPDTTATKASLIAADTALARQLASSGPDALIELLETNAPVLIPESPILRGAAEARDPLRARYGAPSKYTWHVMHAVASTDGALGCTVGIVRFTDAKAAKPEERGGVYETCWRRDGSGKWKIAALQSSDDFRPRPSVLYLVGKPLEKAPHSATVSKGDDQLYAALEMDARFASMAAAPEGPLPAFVAFAAPDAISMIAPDSARGHAEIERLFEGIGRQFALLWSPDRSFGAASGGLAFTVGRSVRIPIQGQKAPERHGKFLTIWRQNPDGGWSWIFDLGSLRRWQQN
jgi:ketosteroid isomerase-like protein